MLYLTLLDQFHPGIYSSQVIDVCEYLNKKHKAKIRLVAFLSIRELLSTGARKKLKALFPEAMVLPAFPGIKNFQWTGILLAFVCLITGERVAICRNAFCTKMALRVKRLGLLKKIVLDGRSAIAAEIKEYDVFPIDYMRVNSHRFEEEAVNNSDFRMAVSKQLVGFWREHYGYQGDQQIVLPCTLDQKYFNNKSFSFSPKVSVIKKELGFTEEDIVLVYSGSSAPWQSFELLEKLFVPLLLKDTRVKILFLSKETKDNKRLQSQFPGRVLIKWLEHKDVLDYLACCDYGILVREQSNTNKVASPTKFAEYLYAGLPVLISEHLGDFSEYTLEHNCGYVIKENATAWPTLGRCDSKTKSHCFELARRDFMKESKPNSEAYQKLVDFLKTA